MGDGGTPILGPAHPVPFPFPPNQNSPCVNQTQLPQERHTRGLCQRCGIDAGANVSFMAHVQQCLVSAKSLGQPCAVVVGLRYPSHFHIHNTRCDVHAIIGPCVFFFQSEMATIDEIEEGEEEKPLMKSGLWHVRSGYLTLSCHTTILMIIIPPKLLLASPGKLPFVPTEAFLLGLIATLGCNFIWDHRQEGKRQNLIHCSPNPDYQFLPTAVIYNPKANGVPFH